MPDSGRCCCLSRLLEDHAKTGCWRISALKCAGGKLVGLGSLAYLVRVNPFASEAVYTRIFFSTTWSDSVINTHSVFWESCRKPCQHATRGCDKRWMTCIHAGVSRSPREHASVPPDNKALPSGNEWMEWNEWMDFCLIPLSTTCSVEVPGTNL